MISGIAGGIGGAAAKALTPLNFCGKTATEKFVQVAEHWVVGTVSDGATGMLTTYVSERIDGKSVQEAMATTGDRMGQIWGNAALTSTVGTVFDAATAPKCFVAGTMITTATGLVAIENIEPGDMVLSENPETGEIEYKTVLTTFVSETDEITHVTIRNESGIQEIIDSTPEHPFYVEGMGWVEASSLHIGMTVWFANGTKGTVEDISNEGLEEPVAVYNFKVEDFHTYFVGYSGVLVHNASCGTTTTSDSTEELPGRSGALNQAKRDADIPRTAQPTKVEHVPMTEPEYAGGHVLKDDSGNVIYTREYHYMNQSGEEIVIQEHSAPHIGSQGPHFNVRPANNTRKGTVSGTKEHYPFKE